MARLRISSALTANPRLRIDVQPLNDLLGLTTVAPECQTLGQSDFVAPGQSTPADEPEEIGDEHYQCCIHPWMRMTVHVRER